MNKVRMFKFVEQTSARYDIFNRYLAACFFTNLYINFYLLRAARENIYVFTVNQIKSSKKKYFNNKLEVIYFIN